jgi:hypothetical protein
MFMNRVSTCRNSLFDVQETREISIETRDGNGYSKPEYLTPNTWQVLSIRGYVNEQEHVSIG